MTSLLAVLDARIADAIAGACDRLIGGELREQFVTDFIPGDAGTSRPMNGRIRATSYAKFASVIGGPLPSAPVSRSYGNGCLIWSGASMSHSSG